MSTAYPSAAKIINLSLVTYSRNDHDLVRASLTDVLNWSLLPKEIIVVDDCSSVPLCTADLPALPSLPPVQILRNPKHFGFTGSKSLGLNSAAGRFILSLDADIRLTPQWLALSLKNASRPDIGLLSGPIVPRCGNHLLGRYMSLTYNMNLNAQGEVNFLPGAAWLMRKEVWQSLKGVDDYQMEAGVDDFFCHKLKANGYKLWLQKEAQAFEVRPTSRLAMVRRGWKWQGASFKRELATKPTDLVALTEAANVLLYSMRSRLARSKQANPRFLYYDLLYLLHALFDLLEQPASPQKLATSPNSGTTSIKATLTHSLTAWLSSYPALLTALFSDLNQLGHKIVVQNAYSGAAIAPAGLTGSFISTNLPLDLKQPNWSAALTPFFSPCDLDLIAAALPAILQEQLE